MNIQRLRDSWNVWRSKIDEAIGSFDPTVISGMQSEIETNTRNIEGLQTTVGGLGTASTKDSTDTITESSTDLIESGAVYTALSAKANTTDLGTASTKDSTNAITEDSTDLAESGAVYSEIAPIKSAIAGNYILTERATITATADGVKTVQTLMKEIVDAFNAYLASNTDVYVALLGCNYSSQILDAHASNKMFTSASPLSFVDMSYANISATNHISLRTMQFNTETSRNKCAISYDGVITDDSSAVLTSGDTLNIYFNVYKKVLTS